MFYNCISLPSPLDIPEWDSSNIKLNINNRHDRFSDNLQIKIKSNFHRFIVGFLNMKYSKLLKRNNKFYGIHLDAFKYTNVESNRKLLEQKIKDIIIRASDKLKNNKIIIEKNKECLKDIIENVDENNEIFKILNMSYKDMFIEYYLKSNKKTFDGELDNESYESHIEQIRNNDGEIFAEKSKRSAESLINDTLSKPKRRKIIKK